MEFRKIQAGLTLVYIITQNFGRITFPKLLEIFTVKREILGDEVSFAP
jgi:hypothetical protein